jgi:demethylmenaquinone methyltransferase/2-methoxy-6-polyprenyl-1,4-benzoquinol methylase
VRRVVGVDFAAAMLGRALDKERRSRSHGAPASFAAGDALRLPLRDASFDVVAIAFGLRNLVDPAAGIAELRRLLRPGGRLVVLEFFAPARGLPSRAFQFYFRHVLPRVGRLLSGTKAVDAYRYLPDSVATFAAPDQVAGWFGGSGLEEVRVERLLAGAVGLIHGRLRATTVRSQETERAACLV